MSYQFWGLTIVMLIAAIIVIAIPLRKGKQLFSPSAILVAIIVPLFAWGLYAHLGTPDAVPPEGNRILQSQFDSTSAPNSQSISSVASVSSLLDGLKERLQLDPDDAGGWLLLARSYEHLGSRREAIAAYEHASSLGKSDPVLEKAFVSSGPSLRGRVALSPETVGRVKPTDTVFIFAKETRDHRMPVVALRKSAADLPINFVLTDDQAMIPGTSLADFEKLVVTARVSRSGLATDSFEGLEVWSEPMSPFGNHYVELLIARASNGQGNE